MNVKNGDNNGRFALTDVGIERKINQDYVYFTLKQTGHLPNLFIVADGMGGHKAGDVASRYTVDEFVSLIENATEKDDITVISEAVTKVNTMLLKRQKSHLTIQEWEQLLLLLRLKMKSSCCKCR